MTETHEHGYADQEGNVFLNAPEGPVKIGQYVAGTPQEGLEFFARKFHELKAEVELTAARLRDGKANPETVKTVIDKITSAIDKPGMLGDHSVLPGLKAELEELIEKRKSELAQKKAELKAAALVRREEIVAAAEALVNSNQWKTAGEQFKSLLDEWKKLPTAERAKEQELWKRFSHARSTFDKARRTHFQQLDEVRGEAVAAKEALVKKAAALIDSTDWVPTANTFKGLMAQWKKLPRAARTQEDALWKTFKEAQDKFFEARTQALSIRDEELSGNLTIKMSLLDKAEALLPIVDLDKAKSAMREIQDAWEKAGHVPRADKDKIDRRLKVVEDAIRKVQDEIWHRTKPEVVERAAGLVASFEASLAKLDKQIEKATKDNKSAEVAKLTEQRDNVTSLLDAARNGASTLS